MAWLALVLLTALFIALHVLPFATATRARLVGTVGGEGPYKGIYAVASLVGLIGAFVAAGRAPPVPLWTAGEPLRWLALGLTLPAFVLLASAYVGGRGRRLARHPMLAGIGLWALAHVLSTGDLAHVLVFAALAAYAPLAMLASDRRDAARDPAGFAAVARTSTLVPFAELVRGRAAPGWRGPAAGVAAWAVFLALHGWLFGASPWPQALA